MVEMALKFRMSSGDLLKTGLGREREIEELTDLTDKTLTWQWIYYTWSLHDYTNMQRLLPCEPRIGQFGRRS